MNKKQLIVAWVMGILLLSGCVTVPYNPCPQKGFVSGTCPFCKVDGCFDPAVKQYSCYKCGKIITANDAIKYYPIRQEEVKKETTRLGGVCNRCGRRFYFSQAEFEKWIFNKTTYSCPYCGQLQDLTMAIERFQYDVKKEAFEDLKRQVAVDDMKREIRRQNTDRSLEVTVH